MKEHLLSLCLISYLLCLTSFKSTAQQGQWTWIKGDSTSYAAGSYGTQGVPSASNNPPGFYEGSEWKGKDGTFWCYGGWHGLACNDVWRYNPQTNEWTWMAGSGGVSVSPVFGTQGAFDAANTPGNQEWCAASWVDTAGKFWLFGGSDGSGTHYNLLWQYDPATNEWAWMHGQTAANAFGNYGTQGVPSVNNDPPSRWESTATWTDKENNLWLFGGMSNGTLNDLWRYTIATGEWTWMSGSSSLDQHSTYGIQGVADPANVPGARRTYAKWIDKNENLWMFAGYGYNAAFFGELNDLWKYNIATNEWTWMSGTDQLSDVGLSGPPCDLSPDYRPSARYETRACWRDKKGNFWLYGGFSSSTELGELWVYVPDSNAWALVTTSTFAGGFYGTQGVSSSYTHPPGKMGALPWTDSLGNLWLSNGGFIGAAPERNDVWKFVIDPNCPFIQSAQVNFVAADTTLCEKFCIDFYDSSANNPTAWQWFFPGGDPSSSTDQNPTNICYNTPGVYDVTLIATGAGGSDSLTLSNYITVYTNPFAPTIDQVGNTLTSSPATSYQWQLNSVDIPGATNQAYTITQSGLYTVIIGDDNGCTAQASVDATYVGIEDVDGNSLVSVFPNPSSGSFMIELSGGSMVGEVSIDVVNTLGQNVFSSEEKIAADFKKQIDLSAVARGVYFIGIKTENIFVKKKIIITK